MKKNRKETEDEDYTLTLEDIMAEESDNSSEEGNLGLDDFAREMQSEMEMQSVPSIQAQSKMEERIQRLPLMESSDPLSRLTQSNQQEDKTSPSFNPQQEYELQFESLLSGLESKAGQAGVSEKRKAIGRVSELEDSDSDPEVDMKTHGSAKPQMQRTTEKQLSSQKPITQEYLDKILYEDDDEDDEDDSIHKHIQKSSPIPLSVPLSSTTPSTAAAVVEFTHPFAESGQHTSKGSVFETRERSPVNLRTTEKERQRDKQKEEELILNKLLQEDDEEEHSDKRSVASEEGEQMDPLQIIDAYENSQKSLQEAMKTSYLEFDPSNTAILTYITYTQYSQIIHKLKNTEYVHHRGRPSCIYTNSDLIYVGNSQGIIRIFDYSEKEYKPIKAKETEGHSVCCIDVTKNGQYLVCGFKNGYVMLWDLGKWELKKMVTNAHSTSVLSIKFLKSTKLAVISSDLAGNVSTIEFAKGIFLSSVNSTYLVSGCTAFALAPLFTHPLYECRADEASIVAIGSLASILVVMLEPTAKRLCEFKRWKTVKEGTVPYLDWGRGALPDSKENRNPILAYAWGKVIQLVQMIDTTTSMFAGYYECEYDIQSLWFLGESIIFISTSRKELKLLYTGYFKQGKYADVMKTRDEYLSGVTGGYSGKENPELKREVDKMDELVGQTHQVDSEKHLMTYHQTIIGRGKQLLLLGKGVITGGYLLTWNEYLEKLKNKGDWLIALSVGLEMYNGRVKGFGDIPENEEFRHESLRGILKNFLSQEIMNLLEKDKTHRNQLVQTIQTKQITRQLTHDFNSLSVIVSIEFCLGIAAIPYLFSDLLTLFEEYKIHNLFLENLEPFIKSGRFRKIPFPDEVLKKLTALYLDNNKMHILERIILFLDLSECNLTDLAFLCEKHKMFSSYIYIKTMDDDYKRNYMFIEPLMVMNKEFTRRNDLKTFELKQLLKDSFNKEIEASKLYIGYKILWYIQLCFNGDKFPKRINEDNKIKRQNWPPIVYVLINWILIEENLKELLNFDIHCVFDVLAMLFENKEISKFVTKNEEFNTEGQYCPSYQEILEKLSNTCERNEEFKHYFALLLGRVSSQPDIQIPSRNCLSTAQYLLGSTKAFQRRQSQLEYNPDELQGIILNMIKNCKALKEDDFNSLIQKAEFSPHNEVYIFLLEQKGDYNKCFEKFIGNKNTKMQFKVFKWLNHIHATLNSESKEYEHLKSSILNELNTLLSLDMKETAELVEKWFKHQHEQVISKLSDEPDLQLQYVKRVLFDKEPYIEQLMIKEKITKKNQQEYEQYKNLLILNIKLLCQKKPAEVYSFVKKKYYPIDECLKLCKEYNILDAQAYLLKRIGDLNEALEMDIKILSESYQKLINEREKDYLTMNKKEYTKYFKQAMKVCEKHASTSKSSEESEHLLWFVLLDELYIQWLKIQGLLNEKRERAVVTSKISMLSISSTLISQSIRDLLKQMSQTVSLPVILKRIIENHGELELESMKEVFLSMLTSYFHQEKILGTAKNILGNNIITEFDKILKTKGKGTCGYDNYCGRCKLPATYRDNISIVIFFSCGHVFHRKCLNEAVPNNQPRICISCRLLQQKEFSIDKMLMKDKMKKKKKDKEIEEDKRFEMDSDEDDFNEQMIAQQKQEGKNSKEEYLKRLRMFEASQIQSFSITMGMNKEIQSIG